MIHDIYLFLQTIEIGVTTIIDIFKIFLNKKNNIFDKENNM